MNPYLNPRQGLRQNQGAAMHVKKGLNPVEKAKNEAFRESAGRQANEAAKAMQTLASTYGNTNTGVSKNCPSARRISTGATPPPTQPFEFRLASPCTSEDSDTSVPPYVPRTRKEQKKSQPSQSSVGSSSDGKDGARRRNKSKKGGRQATLSKEDTDDDVLDVSGDSTEDEVVVVEASAKKRKSGRSGGVGLKQGRKKKRETTPTSVAPLKLTCEIELGPTTLAAIAEHVEALFLQKMMAAQLPDH
jgi:hypothetical protein